MAGSRLELIGTIFSRTTGLLRTKAVKYEDRPIWYDVYRVFPPKYEPRADREPILAEGMSEEVPDILYNEDISRAALFKKFGKNPGGRARNLLSVAGGISSNEEQLDATKRFIQRYNEVQLANSEWTSEQIVESISQEFSGRFGGGTRRIDKTSETRTSEKFQTRLSKLSSSADSTASPDDDDDDITKGKRHQKRPTVTVDTLLSMFKKAKGDDDKSKEGS